MLNIELEAGAGTYTSFNQATTQVAGFYDGLYTVVLTGGYRPKYSDPEKKVRFTSILVACDENGEISKDFAQVLEIGANLSKIIYKGNYLSVKSSNDYVNKWQFDKKTFGTSTPIFTFGMMVSISSTSQYGFVKPFGFDTEKELTKDESGNYVIREDLKAIHSVFTLSKTGKTAKWAVKGNKELTTFADDETRKRVEKHINAFFKQQAEFAKQQIPFNAQTDFSVWAFFLCAPTTPGGGKCIQPLRLSSFFQQAVATKQCILFLPVKKHTQN